MWKYLERCYVYSFNKFNFHQSIIILLIKIVEQTYTHNKISSVTNTIQLMKTLMDLAPASRTPFICQSDLWQAIPKRHIIPMIITYVIVNWNMLDIRIKIYEHFFVITQSSYINQKHIGIWNFSLFFEILIVLWTNSIYNIKLFQCYIF